MKGLWLFPFREIFDEGHFFRFWKRTGFVNPGYVADSLIRVRGVLEIVTKLLAAAGSQKE